MTRCIRSLPFGPFAKRMFASVSRLRSPTCAGMTAWASEDIAPEARLELVNDEPIRRYEDRSRILTLAPLEDVEVNYYCPVEVPIGGIALATTSSCCSCQEP
jgi:hypothetical protein